MLNRGRLNSGGLVEGLKNHRVMNKPPRHTVVASYINGSPLRGLPTTSRATVSPMYADASGDLVQYAANNVALVNGDSVACWPGFTNKCTTHGVPQSAVTLGTEANFESNTTNLAATDFGSGAQFGVVDVTSAIDAAGLSTIDPDGLAYRIDNSGGSATAVIDITGPTANTNTHTASMWARVVSGSGADMRTSVSDFTETISGSDFARYTNTFTPSDGSQVVRFRVPTGCVADFLLPQLTETAYLAPDVPCTGSSVAVDASEPVSAFPDIRNDFVVKATVTIDAIPQAGARILSFFEDANNNAGLYVGNIAGIFAYKRNGGAFVANDASVSWSLGSSFILRARFSSTQGVDIWVDETKGSNWSNTDNLPSLSNIDYGFDERAAATRMLGDISDVQIIKVAPNITDAEVLAL